MDGEQAFAECLLAGYEFYRWQAQKDFYFVDVHLDGVLIGWSTLTREQEGRMFEDARVGEAVLRAAIREATLRCESVGHAPENTTTLIV